MTATQKRRRALLQAAHFAQLLAYGEDAEYYLAWAVYFAELAAGREASEPADELAKAAP